MASVILMLAPFAGCKKYLDEKPNKSLVVISSVKDCQALLDFDNVMNFRDPASGEVSGGDYYLKQEDYDALYLETERRMYTWQPDNIFEIGGGNDWDFSYRLAYYSNLALEGLQDMDPATSAEFNNVKGQALFWRAKCFFQNVLLWSPAFDSTTTTTDLGIPLRLSSDFNTVSKRSSVNDTYRQIINDLAGAASLLPDKPLHVLRPSRPAAYGMLARVYLSMRAYDSCLKYSNLCLNTNNALMDYNGDEDIDPAAAYPFRQFNKEVIFCTGILGAESIYAGFVDTVLYNSYLDNDLRKTLFYNNNSIQFFRGNYQGLGYYFSGIATDEVYLMRAECYARLNQLSNALADLNTLMSKRIQSATFEPFVTSSGPVALDWILAERRKELPFRGIRWMDIKRLNKEGRNIVLQRVISGNTYTLPPNDVRYALSIPEDIIALSGMEQNPR